MSAFCVHLWTEKNGIIGSTGPRNREESRPLCLREKCGTHECYPTINCSFEQDHSNVFWIILKENSSVDERERETSLFATRWVGFKHLQYIQYKYNKIPTIW